MNQVIKESTTDIKVNSNFVQTYFPVLDSQTQKCMAMIHRNSPKELLKPLILIKNPTDLNKESSLTLLNQVSEILIRNCKDLLFLLNEQEELLGCISIYDVLSCQSQYSAHLNNNLQTIVSAGTNGKRKSRLLKRPNRAVSWAEDISMTNEDSNTGLHGEEQEQQDNDEEAQQQQQIEYSTSYSYRNVPPTPDF